MDIDDIRSAARVDAAAPSPVLNLRQLTERIEKLHSLLREQQSRIDSLEANLAGHEKLLGEIGAYETVNYETVNYETVSSDR